MVLGYDALFQMIECTLAVVAASLPTLRSYFWKIEATQDARFAGPPGSVVLAEETIGQRRVRRLRRDDGSLLETNGSTLLGEEIALGEMQGTQNTTNVSNNSSRDEILQVPKEVHRVN